MSYLLALDQGTTSSRAILYDAELNEVSVAQKPFTLHTPQPSWVEQDAQEIWQTQINCALDAMFKAQVLAPAIRGIGIANQRETTVLWYRKTGTPIARAIVWQDRRTAQWCERLKNDGLEARIQKITGLRLDPYFSASKLVWLLDNVENARKLAETGELCFGTIDSWLIYQLTGEHVMDVSNASRTMLMDLQTARWSDDLLKVFDIPKAVLPRIVPSSGQIAKTKKDLFATQIPVYAAVGDQQSALFGHGCTKAGMAKNTYGTGCFMLMNMGNKVVHSQHKLLSTAAWQHGGKTTYALEGSVFMAGAIVQWLRDNLGFIKASEDIETLAAKVPDTGGVTLVPAFTGLGAPHWQPEARAMLTGMTRGTTKAHIARAVLEAIAFQVADVLSAMQQDASKAGLSLSELRVDGGACRNNMLMQFQADILGVPVLRPTLTEVTALGAVKMAGLAAGLFNSNDLAQNWQLETTFEPRMSESERNERLAVWQENIALVLQT